MHRLPAPGRYTRPMLAARRSCLRADSHLRQRRLDRHLVRPARRASSTSPCGRSSACASTSFHAAAVKRASSSTPGTTGCDTRPTSMRAEWGPHPLLEAAFREIAPPADADIEVDDRVEGAGRRVDRHVGRGAGGSARRARSPGRRAAQRLRNRQRRARGRDGAPAAGSAASRISSAPHTAARTSSRCPSIRTPSCRRCSCRIRCVVSCSGGWP